MHAQTLLSNIQIAGMLTCCKRVWSCSSLIVMRRCELSSQSTMLYHVEKKELPTASHCWLGDEVFG